MELALYDRARGHRADGDAASLHDSRSALLRRTEYENPIALPFAATFSRMIQSSEFRSGAATVANGRRAPDEASTV